MLAYALSFAAGLLTVLSPCVLPALPIVVGSAAREHRYGPLWLASGMVLSFTAFGLIFASLGPFLGIDRTSVRTASACLIVLFGMTLAIPALERTLQAILAPISQWMQVRTRKNEFTGPTGQLALGTLLGGIWSPCIGPTLGAALGLASQAGGWERAAAMMLLFGIGSALPLIVLAYSSRKFALSRRHRWTIHHRWAKPALGTLFTVVGASILLGADKTLEAILLRALPETWLDLITAL